MSILFDFPSEKNKPKTLNRIVECPMVDATTRWCGYLIVASSALLTFILLGGF